MSEIITDKLTGKTAAGDVTITDGSVTMTLNHGLEKTTFAYNPSSSTLLTVATATGSSEALNVSSYTDNTTGDMDVSLTNAMANSQYIFTSGMIQTNNTCTIQTDSTASVVGAKMADADSNSAQDNLFYGKLTGDLA